MKSGTLRIAGLGLALLFQLSPTLLHAWQLGEAGLEPAALPAGLSPFSLPLQADLDQDGHPESLALAEGQVQILSGGAPAWTSPSPWQVVQAQVTDLDGDRQPEATLLVWRPFQPWPVDQWLPNGGRISTFQDAAGQSCHFILVHWERGRYRQLWAGSAMVDPVRSFAAVDLDENGRQELITLESRYRDPRSAPGTAIKVWEWNGFGFSLVSSLKGTFWSVPLVRAAEGPALILVP